MIFADFILQHQADDLSALALSRERYSAFPEFGLALCTLEARRKLAGKVPEWIAVPSLRFPLPLSAEQCSSSETAFYKAMVLAGPGGVYSETVSASLRPLPLAAPAGPSLLCGRGWPQVSECTPPSPIAIADLTGGLGVDAWAFAKAGCKVLYNDMRSELVEAARYNFTELGITGVQFSCAEVVPGAIGGILKEDGIGDGEPDSGGQAFKPDAFFLDPARRDSAGGKVFRIADCSPDVTALLPELFTIARYVLVKLSPMLDIALGARELGPSVREVHVVGSGGECKELLFLLDREFHGDYTITVADGGSTLQFTPDEEQSAQAMLAPAELPSYLFVPGKALLKAGCFKLLSQRYELHKAGTSAHLYFAAEPLDILRPFGKWYRVLESAPLDKRGISDFATRYPSADVTARDIPLTSDALRKRLSSSSKAQPHASSGKAPTPTHIFAFHHTSSGRNLLLATSPLIVP